VDSSFHHFLDYNLDPRMGCPSFVTEACGLWYAAKRAKLAAEARMYAQNIAQWLAE